VESDFTTASFTQRYDSVHAVELMVDRARIGRAVYPGVRLEDCRTRPWEEGHQLDSLEGLIGWPGWRIAGARQKGMPTPFVPGFAAAGASR
jgi:hypothetical protein